jgi:hypothetical protein
MASTSRSDWCDYLGLIDTACRYGASAREWEPAVARGGIRGGSWRHQRNLCSTHASSAIISVRGVKIDLDLRMRGMSSVLLPTSLVGSYAQPDWLIDLTWAPIFIQR